MKILHYVITEDHKHNTAATDAIILTDDRDADVDENIPNMAWERCPSCLGEIFPESWPDEWPACLPLDEDLFNG